MPDFSVIITTYNRPHKVVELVKQLLAIDTHTLEIIVVDSSDAVDTNLQSIEKINYIQSHHKNQPYQRYLGYLKATAEYLLFLDDDMEFVHNQVFATLTRLLQENDVSGIALNFEDKHSDTSLAQVPKSTLFKQSSIKNLKNWFTGLPNLPTGVLGLCGNRGKKPSNLAPIQYVGGGAFLARREKLFQNFNCQLLDLFEEKKGMGEDAIIGYGLHQSGNLLFYPELLFLHNDLKDSNYAMDLQAFSRRVLFSRLYLSLERNRLNQQALWPAKLHYHWYSFWRLLGYAVNYMLHRTKKQKSILIGAWQGYKLTFSFNFAHQLHRNAHWMEELNKNTSIEN
ncbi:MAG: glycosyltransferase [Crocinitomicaceae bacterium]|nr:glycosyltransferase [Crocinitomicaceae bacterium]